MREIDKILGQAMIDNLELEEEVQGYELVQIKERVRVLLVRRTKKKREASTDGPHQ